MATPTTKDDLLALIASAHQRLEASLRTLTDDQINAPLLEGDWSVRDALAHLSFWEQRALYALQHEPVDGKAAVPEEIADLTGSADWTDAANARVYERNRGRDLSDIRAEFERSYADVLQVIGELSDDDVFSSTKLSRQIGQPVLDLIAGNTYEHYDEHTDAIERAFPQSS